MIDGFIESPRPPAEANAVASAAIIRQGLGNGHRLIGFGPVAGSGAAKPMAKTTDLNVKVVATARCNYSPIPLVAAWAFEPAIAIAYGYDESRHVGPRGETRRRARDRPC